MTASDPRIGTVLGGCRIEQLIGVGGMGVVYKALQIELQRPVALKLLAPDLAGNPGFRERFDRERRRAAAIDHPHIVPLYGTGTVRDEAGAGDDLMFIVMRYVDGTLRRVVERHAPLSLDRALTIAGQVADALDAAHAGGLVHRDVKPENVLVARTASAEQPDHCYLTDFGLTKDTSEDVDLTESGHFVGTIDYVAPEQINATKQGPATDQYALACVLYECLTGHPPYAHRDKVRVMDAHLQDDPPLLTAERPDCPQAMDAILAQALAKDPEDRHASCGAMVAAAKAAVTSKATVVAGTVPSPGRAPEVTARRAPRIGARARIALVLAVVAAGVAGVAAGRLGRDDSTPAAGNVASVRGMSLRFPADWESLPLPPAIPGLAFEDRIAISPRSAGGREGLLAGPLATSGARLLPDELRGVGDGRTAPRRAVVRLGEAQAFRYAGLRPAGFTGVVTAYLLLTDRGRAAIACYASARSPGFDRRCAAIAASLELNGIGTNALAPSATYADGVSAVLAGAARTRATGRRRLREARTSIGQARATAQIAKGYATAVRRARALPAPAAAADVNASIAAALRDVERAFATATSAARRRDDDRYRAAQRAARRADGALRAAVSALADLGYRVA